MDAIWIPIQPAWGVERNPGSPQANNSIVSKVCTSHIIYKETKNVSVHSVLSSRHHFQCAGNV